MASTRLLREPAGLLELRLARLVRRLQLVHAGVDLLPLALTRLGLLLAQRGEPRLELGLLLGERLVDAIVQGLQLAPLRVDRLLHVRLRLARGLPKLGAELLELHPRGVGLADQLRVDDLAREATERRPAQRSEAGVDRRHPHLVDVGDDGGLARGQRGRDLVDEVHAHAGLEQVVHQPAEAADVRAHRDADRASEQPDEAAGDDAHERADRSAVRRLADRHGPRGVLRDHGRRVQGDVAVPVQVLEGGQPLERCSLRVEHRDQDLVAHFSWLLSLRRDGSRRSSGASRPPG